MRARWASRTRLGVPVKTFLLLSLTLSTYIVPMVLSRDPNGVRGLMRMVRFFIVFTMAYTLYVAYLHPTLFLPHRW
jgi:hypothetical protein